MLKVSIGLPLRNRDTLETLLRDLYDPSSPQYRRFLSNAEFTERFGPSHQDYAKVIEYVQSKDLRVGRLHDNRMIIEAEGTASAVEAAFGTTLRFFEDKNGRVFFAPDQEPSVHSEVPILDVAGLSDINEPRPTSNRHTPFEEATTFARTGSAPGGFFIGNDFRQAYAPGVTNLGDGQVVGLFELAGYFPADIDRYRADAGLPTNTILENVYIDGFDGTPSSANIEVAMNIQMVLAMAPNLERIIVYQGPNINNISTPNNVLNQMATENRAKQLSCSWGFSINATTEQIFLQFAIQGQTMFQASSDSGAYSGNVIPPCDNHLLTTVGATSLTTIGRTWSSETVWYGSGGGISTIYTLPTWQNGIATTANQGSSTMRNFPDVTMVGENVYTRAWDGNKYISSGTSVSAPLWAGLAALVNQRAAENQVPQIGFLNQALYALGKSTNAGTAFNDIVSGNNTNGGSPTRFYAAPGYDLCSGWGSPKGSNLLELLVPFNAMRIVPVNAIALSGSTGGPFNTASFTITNAGSTPFQWSVNNTSRWLSISATNGSLAPGTAQEILLSASPAAEYLQAGTHRAQILFTNVSDGKIQQRTVDLQIHPLLANGDFETGDFTGWILTGSTNNNAVASIGSSFPQAVHSGIYGAFLSQDNLPLGTLSQQFATIPGSKYFLSFWFHSPDDPTPPKKTTPNQFAVSWNGTELFNRTNLEVLGWTNLLFVVSAATTNSALMFRFRNDPWMFGLDDISVQPIPAPRFASIRRENDAVQLSYLTFPGLRYQLQRNDALSSQNWQNSGPSVAATSNVTTAVITSTNNGQYFRAVMAP